MKNGKQSYNILTIALALMGIHNAIFPTTGGCMEVGPAMPVTDTRNGDKQKLESFLGLLPDNAPMAQPPEKSSMTGVYLRDLRPAVRRRLNIPESVRGVLVTDVDEDSPAYLVLRQNDVILEVNRMDVDGVTQFRKIIDTLGGGESVLLLIYRHGGSFYETVLP